MAKTRIGRLLLLFALPGLFWICTSHGHADVQTDSDLRCLIISIKMLESGDAYMRSSATTASLYYLGRLDGRDTGLDLDREVARVMSATSQAQLQLSARTCGALLTSRGAALKNLGAQLSAGGSLQRPH